ncbi:MAG: DCC1-like thiol-disulfide oxidoreductase family protein [Thiolinea sp.]
MPVLSDLPDAAQPVVVFDGLYHFCAASVRFVMVRLSESYRFVPMQSETGAALMPETWPGSGQYRYFLAGARSRCLPVPDAVIELLSQLKYWRLLRSLRWIPRRWQDAVYLLLARHRYRWFGQRSQCFIPTPAQRQRL